MPFGSVVVCTSCAPSWNSKPARLAGGGATAGWASAGGGAAVSAIRERFGGKIYFGDIGLLQHVHHSNDAAVFSVGGTPDDDAQIRVVYTQGHYFFLQGSDVHFLFVQEHFAVRLDRDVVDFRFGVFGPSGGRRPQVRYSYKAPARLLRKAAWSGDS